MLRPAPLKLVKGIRKMNKLHSSPQSVRVLRYKLDSRDHYQKGTPQPSISKISQSEKETRDSQHLEERYHSVNSHGISQPPNSNVNDSNAQEVLERNPQTQIMTTEISNRVQNQSSRQELMASIRARRSFIKSTDLSSDMNPNSAVVIEDTLVKQLKLLIELMMKSPV